MWTLFNTHKIQQLPLKIFPTIREYRYVSEVLYYSRGGQREEIHESHNIIK